MKFKAARASSWSAKTRRGTKDPAAGSVLRTPVRTRCLFCTLLTMFPPVLRPVRTA